MESARRNQRDLFEPTIRDATLHPELRTRLAPLLQALLAEAAGIEPCQDNRDDLSRKEAGDDQDHA
jgi:hypothetical protein